MIIWSSDDPILNHSNHHMIIINIFWKDLLMIFVINDSLTNFFSAKNFYFSVFGHILRYWHGVHFFWSGFVVDGSSFSIVSLSFLAVFSIVSRCCFVIFISNVIFSSCINIAFSTGATSLFVRYAYIKSWILRCWYLSFESLDLCYYSSFFSSYYICYSW